MSRNRPPSALAREAARCVRRHLAAVDRGAVVCATEPPILTAFGNDGHALDDRCWRDEVALVRDALPGLGRELALGFDPEYGLTWALLVQLDAAGMAGRASRQARLEIAMYRLEDLVWSAWRRASGCHGPRWLRYEQAHRRRLGRLREEE